MRHRPGFETTRDPSSFAGPDIPVELVMARQTARIDPDATLRQVATKLAAVNIGALVIGSLDEVFGIISERDLARAVAEGADLDTVTALEIGTAERPADGDDDGSIVRCASHNTTAEVARLMADGGLRHVLVTDGDQLLGIVSAHDLLAAFAS